MRIVDLTGRRLDISVKADTLLLEVVCDDSDEATHLYEDVVRWLRESGGLEVRVRDMVE